MKEEYFYVLQYLYQGEWLDLLMYPESMHDKACMLRDKENKATPNSHRVMWRKVTTEDITEVK